MKIRELSPLILLALVVTVAGVRQPSYFSPASINGILLWVPLLLVVGIGQLLAILTRGIDVSVGSMLGLSGIAVGMLFRATPDLPIAFGMLAGLACGALLGSMNGALIAWAKVPPIIATLGTLSAYRGVAFILSRGEQIDSNDIPVGLTRLSLSGPLELGGVVISWLLVIAVAIALAGAWFLHTTRPGRNMFAIGSNPEAARLRGVPVSRTLFLAYLLGGVLSGIAGVMYAARFGFVNPASAGSGFELTVIAAVAIGGTRMTGGVGSVAGVALGSLLLAAIYVALSVLGIDASWQMLVYGAVILLALGIDALARTTMERRHAT